LNTYKYVTKRMKNDDIHASHKYITNGTLGNVFIMHGFY
jgi:hypothetical protein